jgi:hypothetical protein
MESAVWLNYLLLLGGFSLAGFLLGDRLRGWAVRGQTEEEEAEILLLRRELQPDGGREGPP